MFELMRALGLVDDENLAPVTGGLGDTHEDGKDKRVSSVITQLGRPAMTYICCNEIKAGEPCLFDDPEHKTVVACCSYSEHCEETFQMKAAKADLQMEEHPHWQGLIGKVHVNFEKGFDFDPGFQADNFKDEGAEAWVFTNRKGVIRDGAKGFPLTGMGCLLGGITGDLFVLLVPVDGLLKQGVALPDVLTHLETQTGLKFMQSECILTLVRVGSVLYVPYGWQPLVIYYGNSTDKEWRTGFCHQC